MGVDDQGAKVFKTVECFDPKYRAQMGELILVHCSGKQHANETKDQGQRRGRGCRLCRLGPLLVRGWR